MAWQRLFRDKPLGRLRLTGRRGRRNRKCQPSAPSRGPVGRIEIAVGPQTQESLHAAQGEIVSNLRTNAENARPEAAQNRVLTGVVGDLLIGISGDADEKLLGEEMRGAPVEVKIDTAA